MSKWSTVEAVRKMAQEINDNCEEFADARCSVMIGVGNADGHYTLSVVGDTDELLEMALAVVNRIRQEPDMMLS